MNDIYCLGLNFLAKCPSTHYSDHFLFNLGTAVSSLAVVVAIYALLLERRFRVRLGIKRSQRNRAGYFVLIVLFLAFIGAILPYVPGEPLPLIGYPIFWEIIAFFVAVYLIFQAIDLTRPIRKLSKKQIESLVKNSPYDTLGYHGSVDLMVKEADHFWTDLLKKSLTNKSLGEILVNDFINEDFLKVAVKSQYILMQTAEVLGKTKPTENTKYIKYFLKEFFLLSMTVEDSVISSDLRSSYKPIMQHIVRKRKLTDVILGNAGDLFSFGFDLRNKKNKLNVMERFLEILKLYLGKRYHYTEDKDDYMSIIQADTLKELFEFLKDSLGYLDYEQKSSFMHTLSFMFPELKNLPQDRSEILANGIYEILEEYASRRDWSKNSDSERHLCIQIGQSFVNQNKYTKKVFQQRLLEQIVGSDDDKKITKLIYNLNGYYPMMIPVYFFIYGSYLFTQRASKEDFEFNMTILKKMQKNLPEISDGKTQQFMKKDIPEDERTAKAIKRKAEMCLKSMFPDNIVYSREENSLTYYFAGDEDSRTLLLNETVKENKFVFK